MNQTLAIDIGGTKTLVGAISSDHALHIVKEKTYPGKDAILRTINAAIANPPLVDVPVNNTILIGFPGSLTQTEPHVILPGSCPNIEAKKGEWNHVDLEHWLKTEIGANFHFFIVNDAYAQFAGGLIEMLHHEPERLRSRSYAGYIGPGTGLGGGLAAIDAGTVQQFIGDGRFSDIGITDRHHDIVRAESILSGNAFKLKHGIDVYTAIQDPQWQTLYRQDLAEMGTALAQIVTQLSSGKISPYHAPSYSVPKTSLFILGGSLGARPPFSTHLISLAKDSLPDSARNAVYFYPIRDLDRASIFGLNALWLSEM